MKRGIVGALLILAIWAPVVQSAAVAQGDIVVAQSERRSLFDILFGRNQPTPPAQASPPAPVQQPRAAPAQPAPVRLTIVPGAVEKNENSVRLAVFGDTLASDLVGALERFYAEDPNLVVLRKIVGSSGFVRDDFYDWNEALAEEIAADSFDLAIILIGTNDKQAIHGDAPFSDPWKIEYLARLNRFLDQLRVAGKPAIWMGLPPMRAPGYSASISEISSIQQLASVAAGVEFVDIYERYVGLDGKYTSRGPDLNGQDALMRRNNGIHYTGAGADKLAFFANQALRSYYRGGVVSLEVADPLAGTDAQTMIRLPFQGNGQTRLLQVAGAVKAISSEPQRANELLLPSPQDYVESQFALEALVNAPVGRADAFGVGIAPPSDLDVASGLAEAN